jgi:hypothetical protein
LDIVESKQKGLALGFLVVNQGLIEIAGKLGLPLSTAHSSGLTIDA